jgi:hypothetical protein
MTAIIRTFTPDGFVIAADGRQTGSEDGSVLSDVMQKIFSVESPVGVFAYSICGVAEIPTDDNQQVALNLDEQARLSADSLRDRKAKNLVGYAVRLSRPIWKALDDVHRNGLVSSYPTDRQAFGERGSTICRIGLDGYEGKYPAAVTIRFFHDNGRLCQPEISRVQLSGLVGAHRAFVPSEMIGRLLWNYEFQNDPRLAAYRGPFKYAEDIALQDAIDRSKAYILACSDPEGIATDELCRFVGGHIHVATITQTAGFRWIIPPEG